MNNIDTMLAILGKLTSFESMTWGAIENKIGKYGTPLNHYMPAANICRKAQKRLVDINQDDCDTLYSLHLKGTWRIWGIRDNEILRLLYYDTRKSCYSSKIFHAAAFSSCLNVTL